MNSLKYAHRIDNIITKLNFFSRVQEHFVYSTDLSIFVTKNYFSSYLLAKRNMYSKIAIFLKKKSFVKKNNDFTFKIKKL
jgi:hypothetical protein